MNTDRVLVTGASGWLGRALVRRLASAGAAVRALVHRAPVPFDGAERVEGDLGDGVSLERACRSCRAVVHLAGVTRSPELYRRINVEGTARLADSARRAGVARFVYVSSRTAVRGAGAYGESKLEAERRLRELVPDAVVLRPAEVYGQGSTDAIAALLGWIERSPVVPCLSDPRALIAPVFEPDVVQAIAEAALRPALGPVTSTLAGPEEMTLVAFVRRAARVLGRRARIAPVPTWLIALLIRFRMAGIPPDRLAALFARKGADIATARDLLGFAPRRLEAGLAAWRSGGSR